MVNCYGQSTFASRKVRKSYNLCNSVKLSDILEIHTARLDKLHFVKSKPYDWVETRKMRVSDDENTKYK